MSMESGVRPQTGLGTDQIIVAGDKPARRGFIGEGVELTVFNPGLLLDPRFLVPLGALAGITWLALMREFNWTRPREEKPSQEVELSAEEGLRRTAPIIPDNIA